MRTDSFIALGALNPLEKNATMTVKVRALSRDDPKAAEILQHSRAELDARLLGMQDDDYAHLERDEETKAKLVAERALFQERRKLLEQVDECMLALALGRERGFVEKGTPDTERSEQLQGYLTLLTAIAEEERKDGQVSAALTKELKEIAEQLAQAAEQEKRSVYRLTGNSLPIKHVGRLTREQAERLVLPVVDLSKEELVGFIHEPVPEAMTAGFKLFQPAEEGLKVFLEPGDVCQAILRVHHTATVVLAVEVDAHVAKVPGQVRIDHFYLVVAPK